METPRNLLAKYSWRIRVYRWLNTSHVNGNTRVFTLLQILLGRSVHRLQIAVYKRFTTGEDDNSTHDEIIDSGDLKDGTVSS